MADKIFPKGIRTFAPRQGAPDFVLGDIVVSIDELTQFVKDNPQYLSEYKGQKQLKLQLTRTQGGVLMLSVNTYNPNHNKTGTQSAGTDDLPF